MNNKSRNSILAQGILLLIAFTVYSFSGIFSKSASLCKPLSLNFFLCFGGVITAMGLYAMLWQKVLEFLPLNKAFLCKSVTILIVLCISHFLFNEVITINNIIGAVLILCGLVTLTWKD